MDGYSKSNNKTSNKAAALAIASAVNNTINECIMLFGGEEEDVKLFEGR